MELSNEQQVLQTVINEAWENENFKNELLENPLLAIEKLTGQRVQVPEGKTLVVRDQTNENTIYINIPAEVKLEDVELGEKELELVAGGAPLLELIHILPTFPPCFPIGPKLDGFKS
ncbi:hypothetical protein [Zobellia sp. B3R18]|uniref:hypothetical protein n=1 Tax=Zobellia sp. B3R18 TaxID=2841568 RepID=UPI001C0786A9|nr:hypothetical protein [Zobellia sp. B3R18]MBU2974971.1 hypothetical protein [Zobellia sp. B3R18]